MIDILSVGQIYIDSSTTSSIFLSIAKAKYFVAFCIILKDPAVEQIYD